jgi:hypothetical protein
VADALPARLPQALIIVVLACRLSNNVEVLTGASEGSPPDAPAMLSKPSSASHMRIQRQRALNPLPWTISLLIGRSLDWFARVARAYTNSPGEGCEFSPFVVRQAHHERFTALSSRIGIILAIPSQGPYLDELQYGPATVKVDGKPGQEQKTH